jgi:hypothetical protein
MKKTIIPPALLVLLILILSINSVSAQNDSTAVAKITQVRNYIESNNRYVNQLDSSSFFNLPVAIKATDQFSLCITEATLKPGGALLTAVLQIDDPSDPSKKFSFAASNIPFSFKGGFEGIIRLSLIGNAPSLSICKDVSIVLKQGSFVEWSCNGFERLKVCADINFSSKTFIPVNPDGTDIKGGKLTAYVETEAKNLNDFVFQISLNPFRINGIPGLSFACKNLAIDRSDCANPLNIQFPVNYQSTFPTITANLWKGIYIGDATVTLGRELQNKKNNLPSSISVHHLIIDDNGITGTLAADSVLKMDEGDLGGWDFSIASLSINLLANKIAGANFAGEMHIPVMKEGQDLAYSALIDLEGKYSFTVKPKENLDFELFGDSKLTLTPNSIVKVESLNGKFIPTAILSGDMTFDAPFTSEDSKNSLKMKKVEFQEMFISTADPYFDVKYFGVSGLSQGGFASFPLTINELALTTTKTQAKLSIGVKVNLKESNGAGFSGETTISLIAKRNGLKFKYKGLEVDRISIDINEAPSFTIKGYIDFAKDDPIYGNGFKGYMDATFGEKFSLKALALFGNVNGYRYFFTDGLFSINPGVAAGPFIFYGFGGGLYYHMKQKTGVVDTTSYGASASGLVYEPNKNMSIGIMADIKFGVIDKKLIDAEAKFEIAFNSNGGVDRINFNGNAKCIVPEVEGANITLVKENAQKLAGGTKLPLNVLANPIVATVDMNMDFVTHEFHAELEAFVNMAPLLQGVGANGSAGKCVMHIGSPKWYIYLGTQANPIGIKMMSTVQTTAYFMMGYDIPTGLVINPTVASILKIKNSSDCSNNRNISLQNKGKGIAFGACLAVHTGELTLTPFYASFDIGAGFDILLIDYGEGAMCAGRPGSMGINSWYAKGQAFAYLDGKIGIKVKVFGKRKTFDILSIAAAVNLQAEGPNPIYFAGQAGGRYRILGGMIKGDCKFKLTYGEHCDIVAGVKDSPLADISMIGDLTPSANQTDVDVFVVPQAVFNVPVNQVMDIADDANLNHKYRANLEKCELVKDGVAVSGSYQWNADKTVLVYNPNEILDSKKEYSYTVSVSFDEWVNGTWTTVTENGVKSIETKTLKFTTGEFPTEIPQNVISYSYPINRQYNFYPQEYPQGYIAFNKGLAPMFNLGAAWKQEARFVPVSGGKYMASSLVYDSTSRTVKFNIPTSLACDKIYKLELVNVPQSQRIDKNVSAKSTSTDNDAGSTEITTKNATGTISEGEENAFYTYAFRASKYKTFAQKLSLTDITANMLYEITPYVYHLQSTYESDEVFDKFEIDGTQTQTPLIRRTAILDKTPWYKSSIAPLIYKNYPIQGEASIEWRNISELGVPPIGEIKIWQYDYNHALTDDEIATGSATAINTWAHFMYGLPYNWSHDYTDIRTKLANMYPSMTHTDPQIEAILKKMIWPVIDVGNYPVKFEYVLPGINKVTTTKIFNIKNPYDIEQPSL